MHLTHFKTLWFVGIAIFRGFCLFMKFHNAWIILFQMATSCTMLWFNIYFVLVVVLFVSIVFWVHPLSIFLSLLLLLILHFLPLLHLPKPILFIIHVWFRPFLWCFRNFAQNLIGRVRVDESRFCPCMIPPKHEHLVLFWLFFGEFEILNQNSFGFISSSALLQAFDYLRRIIFDLVDFNFQFRRSKIFWKTIWLCPTMTMAWLAFHFEIRIIYDLMKNSYDQYHNLIFINSSLTIYPKNFMI